MNEINQMGYEIVMTCSACPEQYDVMREGKQVGYLRLRHGNFTAQVDDSHGELAYEASHRIMGDGCFEDEERDYFLLQAVKAIDEILTARQAGNVKEFSMFSGQGAFVWQTHPDQTSSVIATTMGKVTSERIAAALNLLDEHEARERLANSEQEMEEAVDAVNDYILYGSRKERIDSLREEMRKDVALLRKIIQNNPQEAS